MQTITDAEIIANHSPSVRARARLELTIVNALIARAAETGAKLAVHATYEENEYSDEPYDVKSALFDLDDATVVVNDAQGESMGWVRLVFGNDGWDLISDYSARLESFLRPVLDVSNSLA